MWCFLGFGDTFEFLECIRETDTTERFFVFGAKTSVFVAMTRYSKLDYRKCKAFLLDSQKHNIILYYYSMFCVICGGVVYILGHATGSQERHICYIHKLLIKSAFPRHFTQTKPKTPLR